MARLLARATITVLANAVALVVASVLLAGVALDLAGFIVAVLVFTGVSILSEPLVRRAARTKAPVVLGSSALIATLVSLVVTVVVSDGLRIRGLGSWVLAAVLVWSIALAARLLLPLAIFKRVLGDSEARRPG